jgi:hypothetical protein
VGDAHEGGKVLYAKSKEGLAGLPRHVLLFARGDLAITHLLFDPKKDAKQEGKLYVGISVDKTNTRSA